MNLRETRIRERRPALVRPPDRRAVRPLGIRRQIKHVPVAAGRQNHRVRHMGLNLAGHQIARDNAARLPVDHHQIEHLGPRVHRHAPRVDLRFQSLIRAQQQLLPRLSPRVKRTGNLRAAERAVRQQPAVLAGKRHALRHALVDDADAVLRQPVHVVLARPEIAALHRVVEQPVNAVAVVLVVLRRVDAALRRDGMRTARAVLEAETLHVVAQFAQGRRGRPAPQARAHHDHVELPLIRRIDQLHIEASLFPGLFDRSGGNSGVEFHSVL